MPVLNSKRSLRKVSEPPCKPEKNKNKSKKPKTWIYHRPFLGIRALSALFTCHQPSPLKGSSLLPGHILGCLSSLCKDSSALDPLVPNPKASALGSWGLLLILQGTPSQIHTGRPRALLFPKVLSSPIGCHQLFHQHLLELPEMCPSQGVRQQT